MMGAMSHMERELKAEFDRIAAANSAALQELEREQPASDSAASSEVGKEETPNAPPAKLESREDLHSTETQREKEGLAPVSKPARRSR